MVVLFALDCYNAAKILHFPVTPTHPTKKKLQRGHKKEDVHFTMKHPPSFIHSTQLILNHDRLVLQNEGLHDAPANEIGYGTDTEDDHIGCGLTFETEHLEGSTLTVSPGEEHT